MEYLTQDELLAVLRAINGDRRKLLVKVAYWHGLRATEAINLTAANIQSGFVIVKRLKGSLKTSQPYVRHDDPELDEAVELAELAKTLKPKERLFDMNRFGFYRMFQRAGEKIGLPPHKRHPHILKHTCAMQAVKGGVHMARQYLGHRNLSSTGRYLGVSDQEASASFANVIHGAE